MSRMSFALEVEKWTRAAQKRVGKLFSVFEV